MEPMTIQQEVEVFVNSTDTFGERARIASIDSSNEERTPNFIPRTSSFGVMEQRLMPSSDKSVQKKNKQSPFSFGKNSVNQDDSFFMEPSDEVELVVEDVVKNDLRESRQSMIILNSGSSSSAPSMNISIGNKRILKHSKTEESIPKNEDVIDLVPLEYTRKSEPIEPHGSDMLSYTQATNTVCYLKQKISKLKRNH